MYSDDSTRSIILHALYVALWACEDRAQDTNTDSPANQYEMAQFQRVIDEMEAQA